MIYYIHFLFSNIHFFIKRFENTGTISLISLTKIAMALSCGNEIRELFIKTEIATKENL